MECERHQFSVPPGCSECILVMLKNLLARIHRDGGHHTEWVGLPKSVDDAHHKISQLRKDLDTANYALEK